ncbi:hypothetical protein BKA82DRAFT_4341919 [Pisolithus tinctorius]|nr:hypothetical protein BKA82DRAFT_4341919 [Pisolithus tinctorius]
MSPITRSMSRKGVRHYSPYNLRSRGSRQMFEALPTPLRTPTRPRNSTGSQPGEPFPAADLDVRGGASMYDIVHQAVLNGIPLVNIYYSIILAFARDCMETADAVYIEQQRTIPFQRIFTPLQHSGRQGCLAVGHLPMNSAGSLKTILSPEFLLGQCRGTVQGSQDQPAIAVIRRLWKAGQSHSRTGKFPQRNAEVHQEFRTAKFVMQEVGSAEVRHACITPSRAHDPKKVRGTTAKRMGHEIREKEETHQLDHPILSYTPNRFKTFQTQKWEYLSNECAELDEQGHPGNKSVRRICGSKSERSDAEMHEARREDFKGGPCHQNANISNDPGIDGEPSSSSTSLKKGERCVGETSEIRPKTIGVTPGKQTSRSQPQDNG